MIMNFAKFNSAVLPPDTQELYSNLYGGVGEKYVEILNNSPNEIAVISKMIAYLNKLREVN